MTTEPADTPPAASAPTASPPLSTALVQATKAREIRVVHDAVPVLDTAKFEHMQRIATIMAETSMIPDALCKIKDGDSVVALPYNTVLANCFMVVNQASRWKMDPFAVAQCCSMVHGRLMFEGKLVAGVIDANLGVRLKYDFDNKAGQELGVVVSGQIPGEDFVRTIEGRVCDWHKGARSPWSEPANWKRQLRYRGSREWARAHAPAIMLGVITDDEAEDLAPERRHFDRRERVGATTAVLAAPAQFAAGSVPTADKPAADFTPRQEPPQPAYEYQPEAANAAAQAPAPTAPAGGAPSATEARVNAAVAGAAPPAGGEPARAEAPVPAAVAQPANPAADVGTSTAAEPVAVAPVEPTEPDDLDIIAQDIITQIRALAGNKAALERCWNANRRDFESLDERRKAKVQDVYATALKTKAQRAA